MTPDQQLELLTSCVRLRLEGRKVPESVRRELATVEDALAGVIGPIVRKTVAARLLGVSVQALDRHVAAGRIPVEPIAPGATRAAIPRETVVSIAYERLLHDCSLAAAIEHARVREQRTLEFFDAASITRFQHQIALAARRRDAS